ncbi:MAG: hypothetical protein KGH75_02710 [Rhodospirillales bacterium]|nr:hypothetical protein [Rhodospirillales bacterium]
MTAATFQSTVNVQLSFGVVGEILLDGPIRTESLVLDANGGTVGLAFTKSNTTNVATQGGVPTAGTSVFAGILINPKSLPGFAPASGFPIDPALNVPAYNQGEFLLMGTIVVALTSAANIGDQVQFNNTTGALSAVAPGAAAGVGNTLIPNAVVYRFPTTAAGLAAIRLAAFTA